MELRSVSTLLPTWRRSKATRATLLLDPTPAARVEQQKLKTPGTLTRMQIKESAEKAVSQLGGDVTNELHVLGQHTFQFGVYKDRTFVWALSNDPGYCARLVTSLEMKRKKRDPRDPTIFNIFHLREYIMNFPEGQDLMTAKKSDSLVEPTLNPFLASENGQTGELHSTSSTEEKSQTELRSASSRTEKSQTRELHWASSSSTTEGGFGGGRRVFSAEGRGRGRRKIVPDSTGSSTDTSEPLQVETDVDTPNDLDSEGSRQAIKIEVATCAQEQAPTDCRGSGHEQGRGQGHGGGQWHGGQGQGGGRKGKKTMPVSTGDYLVASEREQADIASEAVVDDCKDDFPLPTGWRTDLSEQDHRWVSEAIFRWSSDGRPVLNEGRLDRVWFEPPVPDLCLCRSPKPDLYFTHRLCLWMPRTLWKCSFRCPRETCKGGELTSTGVHPSVRRVLDVDSQYYLATEGVQCLRCKGRWVCWSGQLLRQMEPAYRAQFPAVVTPRLACDVKVVKLMRLRKANNSPEELLRSLEEQHAEKYLRQVSLYLNDYSSFCRTARFSAVIAASPAIPPPMDTLPTRRRLRAVYCRDLCDRLEGNQAAVTSLFGSVLKLHSSKKITQKLQGYNNTTSAWSTNVANEHGQVLTSVLTNQENGKDLTDMMLGLQLRYSQSGVAPPQLLYVDCNCCSGGLHSMLYPRWSSTTICLDAWTFIKPIAATVTTKTHPLYPKFMSDLSSAIFAWDEGDLKKLFEAKKAKLQGEGFLRVSDGDVVRRISCKDLAAHCRRYTRGEKETECRLGDLLETYCSEQGKDARGIPLLNRDHAWHVWHEQECHVACIQDPPDICLYTQTGTTTMGGICLPVYRCARGLTSLERFHLHLSRFLSGACGSAVHYQAWLVEGVAGWNRNRVSVSGGPVAGRSGQPMRTHDSQLMHTVNRLSSQVFGVPLLPELGAQPKHTGEEMGLEYLLSQNGDTLMDRADRTLPQDVDLTAEMNDGGGGCEEEEVEEDITGEKEEVGEVDQTIFPLSEEDRPGRFLTEQSQVSTRADSCDDDDDDESTDMEADGMSEESADTSDDGENIDMESETSEESEMESHPAESFNHFSSKSDVTGEDVESDPAVVVTPGRMEPNSKPTKAKMNTSREKNGASPSAENIFAAALGMNNAKTIQESVSSTSLSAQTSERPRGNVTDNPASGHHSKKRKRTYDEIIEKDMLKLHCDLEVVVATKEEDEGEENFNQVAFQRERLRMVSTAMASRNIRLERESVQLAKERVQLERDRLQLEAEKLQLEKLKMGWKM